MTILHGVQAFFYRLCSPSYKNEVKRLNSIGSFSDLATEVKTQRHNKAALLAIQDYAYRCCQERMVALGQGKKITLMLGEKGVGSENCLLGQAECMKEVYIQVKQLRGNASDMQKLQEGSSTFKALHQLGKLSELYDLPPDERSYIGLIKQVKEAYIDGIKVRLADTRDAHAQEVHAQGRTIAQDERINRLDNVLRRLQVYTQPTIYDEDYGDNVTFIRHWYGDEVTLYPDYSAVKCALEFLKK